METFLSVLNKFKWLLIPLVVILLLVVVVYSSLNGINKAGVDKETALNAQYLDNQNELGSFISTFYEQLGIADRKSDKLDQILSDAVKGRYEGETSAQPGQGQLFSAITEAYPDLTQNLSVYDRVLDTVSSGRAAYKNKQSKLLDMLRDYDRWRTRGIFHKQLVNMAGYPSDGLEARIGTKTVHGDAARDQMYLIVLPSQAAEAYQTGTLEPLTIPTTTTAG